MTLIEQSNRMCMLYFPKNQRGFVGKINSIIQNIVYCFKVTIDMSGCGASRRPVGVRYEWRTSPCLYKQCAVYDADVGATEGLPAPPYISHSLDANSGSEPIGK